MGRTKHQSIVKIQSQIPIRKSERRRNLILFIFHKIAQEYVWRQFFLFFSLRRPHPHPSRASQQPAMGSLFSIESFKIECVCMFAAVGQPYKIQNPISISSLGKLFFSSPLIGSWFFRSGKKQKPHRFKKEIKKKKKEKKNSMPF